MILSIPYIILLSNVSVYNRNDYNIIFYCSVLILVIMVMTVQLNMTKTRVGGEAYYADFGNYGYDSTIKDGNNWYDNPMMHSGI